MADVMLDINQKEILEKDDESNTSAPNLWDIPGIPEPTAKDLKWWDKLNKSVKNINKSLNHNVKRGNIWRVAKIVEHNAQNDDIWLHLRGSDELVPNYSWNNAIDYASKLKNKDVRNILIELLAHAGGKAGKFYDTHKRLYKNHDQAAIVALAKNEQVVTFLVSREQMKDKEFIFSIIRAAGNNESIVEAAALYWEDIEYLEEALKYTPVVKNEDIFKNAQKEKDPAFFDLLCRAKYEHEIKTGVHFPIYVADEYISMNFKPKKQTTVLEFTASSEWEKQSDHAIYRNHPVEENGSRLRDHFDFAAARVVRMQQMPDGSYNHILNWHMREVIGTKAMDDAEAALRNTGGNPDVFDAKAAKKTVETAKPAPVKKAI